jgi:hypothetical protein
MFQRLLELRSEIVGLTVKMENLKVRQSLLRKQYDVRVRMLKMHNDGNYITLAARKAMGLVDPAMMLLEAKNGVLLVGASLCPRYYASTIEFLQRGLPDTWTLEEAVGFFSDLVQVIEPELKVIDEICCSLH